MDLNTHKNNTFRARRGKNVPQIHRVLLAKTSAFTVRRDNPVASPARRSAQVGRVTALWLRAFLCAGDWKTSPRWSVGDAVQQKVRTIEDSRPITFQMSD
ncbi:hypothetical protein CDAR_223821 [Caerostris darwini]|uniref:Uncharacterized protein n=1 Tax=Caerostris darwini TaxID=1538125 RepID=A0AAV4S073_9ARAC|nr:hypothetical protein CDAR_223821 [Caerostris darwini]